MNVREAIRDALEMIGVSIVQYEWTAESEGQGVVVMGRAVLMPITNWDDVIKAVKEEGQRRVAAFDVGLCEKHGASANTNCELHQGRTPNADICRVCQHGQHDALVALAKRGWR